MDLITLNLITFVIVVLVVISIGCFGGVTIGGVLFMKHLNSQKSKIVINEINDNEEILQSIMEEKRILINQLDTLLHIRIDDELLDQLIELRNERDSGQDIINIETKNNKK